MLLGVSGVWVVKGKNKIQGKSVPAEIVNLEEDEPQGGGDSFQPIQNETVNSSKSKDELSFKLKDDTKIK